MARIRYYQLDHPDVDPCVALHRRSLLRWHWSDWSVWLEDAEVDEPGSCIELAIDGVDAVIVWVAFLGWLSLKNDEAGNGLQIEELTKLGNKSGRCSVTYDSSSFSGLIKGRPGCQPSHANGAIAVVPDIKSLKWNWPCLIRVSKGVEINPDRSKLTADGHGLP